MQNTKVENLKIVEATTFNVEKYYSLAYGTNKELLDTVEARWIEWLQIVKEASWLKYWVHSPYAPKTSCTIKLNPIDDALAQACCEGVTIRLTGIATLIFSEAVWGFGIEEWLRKPRTSTRAQKVIQEARAYDSTILLKSFELEGVSNTLLLPQEFYDLDQWLEQL